MALRVGDAAPSFTLPSEPGQTVDLGQHLGKDKIVLLFFPLAFSSVCTAEMCHMRDDWSAWSSLGAKVFGISVDSPFTNKKFRETEKIPFPLLSDYNKEVVRKYDVLLDELVGLKGVSKRAAFVIDRKGKIAYVWVGETPKNEPDYEAVKQAVKNAA